VDDDESLDGAVRALGRHPGVCESGLCFDQDPDPASRNKRNRIWIRIRITPKNISASDIRFQVFSQ
jgi:hypothetical protein